MRIFEKQKPIDMQTISLMPIKWFGDRNAYNKSDIKIITVGLNPSDREFRDNDEEQFNTSLRFPSFDGDINDPSLEAALNNYFRVNPYQWFQSGFEHILNGMNASYFDSKSFLNRALHTDFCSWWATNPTWSKLSKSEKAQLMADGVQDWKTLISLLNPDILLISIPREYYSIIISETEEFCSFPKTENGESRKKPVIIRKGNYGHATAILGQTWNIPFGALGAKQKEELGHLIIK